MEEGAASVDIAYFTTLVGEADAARLLARAGLAGQSLGLSDFWRLCAENIQARDDESHGIAAQPVPRGSLSVLFTAAKEADTLNEALERFAAAARLIRRECRIVLGRSRDAVHLSVRPVESGARAEIYAECFAVVTHCALRWMTGRRLDPVLVRGAGALQRMRGTLLDSLPAPLVRRGEGTTILYHREDAQAPILPQKYGAWGSQEFENFLALLHERAEPPAGRAATAQRVRQMLSSSPCSQAAVAAELRLSVATLRRRLTDEGTSFRRLAAEIKRSELQGLLATDSRVEEIAARLGLSDDRSLRRFCRDNLGMSPRHYRQFLRGG